MSKLLHQTSIEPLDQESAEKLEKLQELCKEFHLSDDQLLQVEQIMVLEINLSLGKLTNPSSNIKSYITYVSELPTGDESGVYLALDLGGTNFRVLLIEIERNTKSMRTKNAKHAVSEDLMKGSGGQLFNFMADKIKEFMEEHELLGRKYHMGFTFSFPIHQHSLSSAELATWTKGFVCSGVEGQDVVKLLDTALKRHPDIDIEICAILNDTTGCLIACAYKRPDCAVGVIIGTGTNASYVEDISNVDLYEGCTGEKKNVVINTEWGALGNTGSLDFIRTPFDRVVDMESKNVGKQIYEKLISGMYLGELTRLVILEAVQQQIIFTDERKTILDRFRTKDIFLTRYLSEIESDELDSYSCTFSVLKELGLEMHATQFDCKLLRFICESISMRSAFLAAAGVSALLKKMGRKKVTVGVDGSLYKQHPHFQCRMHEKISQLLGISTSFKLVLSEDGSGRGAGLVAAVCHK